MRNQKNTTLATSNTKSEIRNSELTPEAHHLARSTSKPKFFLDDSDDSDKELSSVNIKSIETTVSEAKKFEALEKNDSEKPNNSTVIPISDNLNEKAIIPSSENQIKNEKSLGTEDKSNQNQKGSSAWSSLKNINLISNQTTESTKLVKDDSFEKFKQQMIVNEEREKKLKEKSMFAQQLISLKTSDSKPNVPLNNVNTLKTISLVSQPSLINTPNLLVNSKILSSNSNVINKSASSSLQSIQEMREQEKRRREETAGKIDMNEQQKLMTLFEQNFLASNDENLKL